MNLLMDAFDFEFAIPLIVVRPEFELGMLSYYGYYSFVTATILSLVLTHLEIHYHRLAYTEYEKD